MLGFLRRHRLVAASLALVAVLAGINVVRFLLPSAGVLIAVGAALVLLVAARACGLTWAQLGLARGQLRSGLLWAGGAMLVVAAVYVVGVLLPVTRGAFLDARYHLGVSGALVTAFVLIPVKTILLEEVAFRSVLWGMLARHRTTGQVVVVSSVLFGLWHVLPSLSFAAARGLGPSTPVTGTAATLLVVAGTVVFTAVGGLVAGELRRRSGSVLASMGMHWATNAFGVLFGLVAWRIAG